MCGHALLAAFLLKGGDHGGDLGAGEDGRGAEGAGLYALEGADDFATIEAVRGRGEERVEAGVAGAFAEGGGGGEGRVGGEFEGGDGGGQVVYVGCGCCGDVIGCVAVGTGGVGGVVGFLGLLCSDVGEMI